ncbi:immunoglobulin-like domain-containing protein, partial [Enterococcus faecalis]
TYSVTDSDNNTVTKTIRVTVRDVVEDDTLTVDGPNYIGQPTLSGTYGKDIQKIVLEVNGKLIPKAGKLDGNGHYTIFGVNGWFKATDKVNVVGYTRAGKEVRKVVTFTQEQDITLTVEKEYIIGEANIEGTYGKDIQKIRLEVNGKLIPKGGKLDANGHYVIAGVNGWFKATDK